MVSKLTVLASVTGEEVTRVVQNLDFKKTGDTNAHLCGYSKVALGSC